MRWIHMCIYVCMYYTYIRVYLIHVYMCYACRLTSDLYTMYSCKYSPFANIHMGLLCMFCIAHIYTYSMNIQIYIYIYIYISGTCA